jgi:hypothetical protein
MFCSKPPTLYIPQKNPCFCQILAVISIQGAIMKNRIIKLAAAVVIIAGIAAIYNVAKQKMKEPSTIKNSHGQTVIKSQKVEDELEQKENDMLALNLDNQEPKTFGISSVAQMVAEASTIIRGKFLNSTGTIIKDEIILVKWTNWNIEVMNILYGEVFDNTINVLVPEPVGQEYTANKTGIEVILFMDTFQGQYRSVGIFYDAPPQHSLDIVQKEILKIIESGDHLSLRR